MSYVYAAPHDGKVSYQPRMMTSGAECSEVILAGAECSEVILAGAECSEVILVRACPDRCWVAISREHMPHRYERQESVHAYVSSPGFG